MQVDVVKGEFMKKKFRYLFLLIMCSVMMAPVYAANIAGCDAFLGTERQIDIDEKIANTVHTVILVIQIVSPIILVVLGMIDLIKAVIASKEDEIKKAQMTFVKRLIAAAIVFFVFIIVKLVISFVADDKDNLINCINCFVNGVGDSCTTR